MEVLRTPDERFAELADWSWQPRYAELAAGTERAVRIAYIDEGPTDATPVLLLHGEPTWSYLYRHMVPPLLAAGLRVVAPDLIGFGRSDKPSAASDYSYQRHVDWLAELVFEQLDLAGIVMFCQDWGGLLGLRLLAAEPERFAAVVASNTMLPTGDHDPGDAFRAWREFSLTAERMDIGRIVNGGSARELTAAEIAAYDAPFPEESYKAGARVFPSLVPITPDDPAAEPNRAAWTVLTQYERPFVCAFGALDPITRGADGVLRKLIPGAAGQPHEELAGAAHFSQEDGPERLAQIVLETVAALDAPEASR